MKLRRVVTDLQHTIHRVKAFQSQITDQWGSRLPRDLRNQVVDYLDGIDCISLFLVHSSWYRQWTDERCCRLMYAKLFGECTSRDISIFQWTDTTTWRQRLDTRIRTMRNWSTGSPQRVVTSACSIANDSFSRYGWELDGFVLQYVSRSATWRVKDVYHVDLLSENKTAVVEQFEYGPCVLKNPAWTVDANHARSTSFVIRDKKTLQPVANINSGPAMYNLIECDPASDLVLVSFGTTNQHPTWKLYRADTGDFIQSGHHRMEHLWVSAIYDGTIYAMHGCTMDVVDARSAQLIRQHVKIPASSLVGIVQRYLLFEKANRLFLFDRKHLRRHSSIKTTKKFELMMDVSRRECLIDHGKSPSGRLIHVDVSGRIRHWPAPFDQPWAHLAAFNGRWLVVLHKKCIYVYDYAPLAF